MMSNQDEPITNNPLLPFLRSLQTNSTSPNKSLTPVETLTPSRRARDVKMAKTNEKEEAAKPGSSQICPNYKILYMKDDEILLFGLQVISNSRMERIQILKKTTSGVQFCSSHTLGSWTPPHHCRWLESVTNSWKPHRTSLQAAFSLSWPWFPGMQ